MYVIHVSEIILLILFRTVGTICVKIIVWDINSSIYTNQYLDLKFNSRQTQFNTYRTTLHLNLNICNGQLCVFMNRTLLLVPSQNWA